MQTAGGNAYENREPETYITLQENTEIFSQHGSTGASRKVPLHSIANIKGFKLACININSLYKHIDEIRYILMSSPLEVLAINESKLDNTITDGEIHIPGYVIIRKDRNRHGGGVAIYIKENISCSVRHDLAPDQLDMVCVEINLPYNKSFLVSTWYRPPNANINVFEDYTKFVEKCDYENKQLIVLGDMNCDYFKNPSESHTQRLKFISSAYQLQQLILEPTRMTNRSATLIDLIFTNETRNIAKSGVIHNGMSDHSLIRLRCPQIYPILSVDKSKKKYET